MSLAFVFPGQGSHSVGMMNALAAEFPVVRQTFSEASQALGYDLWQVVEQQAAMLTDGEAGHAASVFPALFLRSFPVPSAHHTSFPGRGISTWAGPCIEMASSRIL